MHELPPVGVVSGDDDFMRDRWVRGFTSAACVEGYEIISLRDPSLEELEVLLLSSAGIFEDPSLMVIEQPSKKVLRRVLDFGESPESSTRILVVFDGKTPKPLLGLLRKLPKGLHRVMAAPPRYEMERVAIEFLVAESKKQGFHMPSVVAGRLVDKAGTDRGLLSFELMKLLSLAAENQSSILSVDYLRVVHRMVEESVFLIVEAVASRKIGAFLESCERVRSSHGSDITMKVVRILLASCYSWLSGAYHVAQGANAKTAAERMGVNQYLFKKRMGPAIRAWGVTGVFQLIRSLSKVERCVLKGSANPWAVFVARLSALCYSRQSKKVTGE